MQRVAESDLQLQHYVDTEADRIVASLFEWLRIPSISAQPDHADDVRRSAEFTAQLMRDAGLEHVEILETAGAASVYSDHLHAGPDAPTALVYGHHDVQPVDPLDQWRSPPFEPVIVDGECRARGAIDDKGQMLYEIEAVRGLLQRDGRLPVNVKFIVEGEEEVGSPHFEDLLWRKREKLSCDVVVASDTGMWSRTVPSTTLGMRGNVCFDVTVRTSSIDLHSGSFGGAVPNAAHVIASIVAGLHDADGRITVPGFYDDVRPLTDEEAAAFAALPLDEEAWKRNAGVKRLEGEKGYGLLERIWTRPTCDVVGIGVGYTGAGIKTIIPAQGDVKVTFRLVPDQKPATIADAFEAWLGEQVPDGIDVSVRREGEGVAASLTPADDPAVGALCRAIARVWEKEPLFTREGGSGPEEALGRVLHAPVLFLGVGLPGDRFHAPNERIVMDQFWKGLLAAGELWTELSRG